MAIEVVEIERQPDKVCIGSVKSVGDAYLGKSGNYQVSKIEIAGKFAADALSTYYFWFDPRWFDPKISKAQLEEVSTASQMISYNNQVSKPKVSRETGQTKGKVSTLGAMLGDRYGDFIAEFSTEPTPKDVSDLLRKYLVGTDVLYTLRQQTDEDGDLTERFNVQSFHPLTDSQVEYFEKAEKETSRKYPLTVTWDTE